MSKSIAMKRYIGKVQSPQCSIGTDGITNQLSRSWARSTGAFREPHEGQEFHPERRLGREEDNELEAFMLDEQPISEVIRSRHDLSPKDPERIGSRIVRAAKKEGVKFMKLPIEACIRSARIVDPRKEVRTILLHRKGDRERVENWRAISMTKSASCIFTYMMARSSQAVNSRAHLCPDNRKD
jgi:hypothetical protein